MTLAGSRYRTIRPIGFPVLVLALAAGCAHHVQPEPPSATPPPSPPPVSAPAPPAPVPVATPGLSARERLARAVERLRNGKPQEARPELVELLSERPTDRHAALLLRTIDTDPKQIYGGDSFAYVVQPRDTFLSLAREFLGDPLNFYGLARFNGIAIPDSLAPQQTIQIPGHPRLPTRSARTRRQTAPHPEAAAPGTAGTASPSAGDPRRAQALRSRGLEQMSAGSIDRAVALLSQAAVLAPDDARIASDLARARRIQATVHSQ